MKTKTISGIAQSVLVLCIILFFHVANAQSSYIDQRYHFGLTASFGGRVNKISSNYAAIDKMNLVEEGGSLGLLWGSRSIETKVTLGFYYSASCVPHTTDLIEMEASANFSPLSLITKKFHLFEPYIIGGFSRNLYKMYGYYAAKQELPTNGSVDLEPHLGNINVFLVSIGTGVAVNLYDSYDFVKLFADVKYSSPVMTGKSTVFNDTHFSDQLSINLGVSFGVNR